MTFALLNYIVQNIAAAACDIWDALNDTRRTRRLPWHTDL